MHMPPGPSNAPILGWSAAGARAPAAAAALLRPVLAVERWPVPPAAFPPGAALVGGAVRDGLLGRLGERPDLDLVVPEDAIALCRQLARRFGGSCVVLDEDRSIARLVLRGWCLDLARQAGSSLEEDLARRDFRINALALPLADGAALLDPTGGLADLAAGVLVAVREENLLADPLRLLRGVRLAAALGFRLEPLTWGWIRRHAERLATVAPERVLVEIEKLAACPGGGEGLALAVEAALLAPWQSGAEPQRLRSLSPELADGRGLAPAGAGQSLALARLAVLFDADALQQLRSSRQLQRRCGQLRHWWLRLGPAAERLGNWAKRNGCRCTGSWRTTCPRCCCCCPPRWPAGGWSAGATGRIPCFTHAPRWTVSSCSGIWAWHRPHGWGRCSNTSNVKRRSDGSARRRRPSVLPATGWSGPRRD